MNIQYYTEQPTNHLARYREMQAR